MGKRIDSDRNQIASADPAKRSVVENQDSQVPAQQAPVQLAKSAPAILPKTSSNFLLLPLVGFVCVCAGLSLLRYAGQES